MQKYSDNFSIEQAKQLSQTPAARQLMALLQQSAGEDAARAAALAKNGDYEGARQLLSSLLSDPRAQALLRQLGGR